MTECSNAEVRDRLPDLANEVLSPDIRLVVMTHVEACAACAAEVEILRVARLVMIAATPRVKVDAIVSALPRRDIRAISSARRWAPWRIAAAVTVLAAGAGGYAVMQQRSGIAPMDSTAIIAVVADSSAGLAMTGTLADLDDAELQALMEGLDNIEALPSTEVEGSTLGLSETQSLDLSDSIARDMEGM